MSLFAFATSGLIIMNINVPLRLCRASQIEQTCCSSWFVVFKSRNLKVFPDYVLFLVCGYECYVTRNIKY